MTASRSQPEQPAETIPASPPTAPSEGISAGWVPSFRSLLAVTPQPVENPDDPGALRPGDQIDDYQIHAVLGRGGFATVYLALQLSLGRLVALKVSANRSAEARTLASLEHGHIVQVHSESIVPGGRLRLLCMQFVPGTTLEQVIHYLSKRERSTWTGQTLLDAVDVLAQHPAMFDPASGRERELLWRASYVEAVCRIGARVAEALAHAHTQGVLHRDIKPSNILINRFGRPLLADFNVSLDPERSRGATGELFGGTLEYMAPEHLDAFNPAVATTAEAVDERSDLYALGLVLFELLTATPACPDVPHSVRNPQGLLTVAAERRSRFPAALYHVELDERVRHVLHRCLEPEKEKRYASAAELAQGLEDCVERQHVERDLPPAGRLTRTALRHPILILAVLAFLPHVLATFVNIAYNRLRIVEYLNDQQRTCFFRLIACVNGVIFPTCLVIVVCLVVPVARAWGLLNTPAAPSAEKLREVRQRALRFPAWVAVMACVGWLTGGVVFPLGLHLFAGGVEPWVFHHFLISFAFSGLIALTYSVFATQFIVLRVLYPRFLLEPRGLRAVTSSELARYGKRLRLMPLLAGLIPLIGAILLVHVPEDDAMDARHLTFRVLITALIALGMLGFALALTATQQLAQTRSALMGRPDGSTDA
jgi:serine/threonine protein kinase